MTSIRQTFYILRGNHCLSSNVIYLHSVSTLEVCIQSQIYRIFRYVWHVLLKNSIVRKILKYTYTVVWTHHDRFGLFSCCTNLSCRSMSTEFKSCTQHRCHGIQIIPNFFSWAHFFFRKSIFGVSNSFYLILVNGLRLQIRHIFILQRKTYNDLTFLNTIIIGS